MVRSWGSILAAASANTGLQAAIDGCVEEALRQDEAPGFTRSSWREDHEDVGSDDDGQGDV